MTEKLRVLCVIADPADLPRMPADEIWHSAKQAAALYPQQVDCQRVSHATESALQEGLSGTPYQLVYFAAHAQCRTGLKYSSIVLENSSGEARSLDGNYFASIVGGCTAVQTVVLQAADKASFCFDFIAEALLERGVRIVLMLPALRASVTGAVLARLYSVLLQNAPLAGLEYELRSAHPEAQALKVLSHEVTRVAQTNVAVAAAVASAPANQQAAYHATLQQKRKQGAFDVFLCYNSVDKPQVLLIAKKLKEAGILPWLDIWDLPPGKPWQHELERQIPTIGSAAVFIGEAGVGPWQESEIEGFLDEFAQRGVPVIPVLLPNVTKEPKLPIFLRRMHQIDFRMNDPDPFRTLIRGITGQRPEDD
jgi:hypothetical protein